MRRALAPLAAVALGASTPDSLAGRVAGAPVRCIPFDRTSTLTILGPRTLAWKQTERRLWVTHPTGQCRPLRTVDTVIVAPFGAQLCRDDRFRSFSPGDIVPSVPCRLDGFVPHDKPEAP